MPLRVWCRRFVRRHRHLQAVSYRSRHETTRKPRATSGSLCRLLRLACSNGPDADEPQPRRGERPRQRLLRKARPAMPLTYPDPGRRRGAPLCLGNTCCAHASPVCAAPVLLDALRSRRLRARDRGNALRRQSDQHHQSHQSKDARYPSVGSGRVGPPGSRAGLHILDRSRSLRAGWQLHRAPQIRALETRRNTPNCGQPTSCCGFPTK